MMYRGYFLEQLAHLRRISGDAKYDDEIRYRYSAEQITAGLYEQFKAPMDANGSSLRPGIDCEVGKVFPVCVTAGGLGMLLYDQLHGTDYAAAPAPPSSGRPRPSGSPNWRAPTARSRSAERFSPTGRSATPARSRSGRRSTTTTSWSSAGEQGSLRGLRRAH
jgi:hypothetical protein